MTPTPTEAWAEGTDRTALTFLGAVTAIGVLMLGAVVWAIL